MAYRVIKTVKGIAYEYEQRSYRLGGQVKTESRYIGPASGSTARPGAGPAGDPGPEEPGRQGAPPYADAGMDRAATAAPSDPEAHQAERSGQVRTESEAPGKPEKPRLSLQIKANLEALKISADSIEAEHKKHLARLEQSGIDPALLPRISIEHGASVTHQKKAFRRAYTVTVPKRTAGNRQKLRTEYRKALGRATIDAIEQSQPETYARLAFAFDASFRASQHALNRYLLNTDDPDKWIKAFALKAFGYMNQVEQTTPDSIGLIDYGERKDWKGEFAELFAAVQGKGFDEVQAKSKQELANARRAETAAIKKKTIWIFARRRAIKRAQARIQAHQENLRKLQILRSVGLA